MKHLLHITLSMMALALPSQALEQRTFYDSGQTKSFEATLKSYDAKSKVVTVLKPSGKTMTFQLDVISEDCQKYVLSKEDLLSISKNVRLKFKEVKDKKVADASNVGFAIEVYNRGKNSIKNVTLNYTIYYDQGDITKGGFIHKTQEGTVDTGKMYDGDTLTVNTSKVAMIRKVLAPVGGGWCGPNKPGGRQVDNMIGIVTDIVVDGEVVRTESSNNNLLTKVLKERRKTAAQ